MKVYLDIITNHTADVIQYRECVGVACPYRSKGDYPYSRKGGVQGAAINAGFAGDGVRTAANFAKLTRDDFAYTPFVAPAEANVKVPAWLNSTIYYHNRGNSEFWGESSLFGDFVGLDDLMTENPRVVQGFIDIYGEWIDRYGIDGFRIDTARHVNSEFWQSFAPAMLNRARTRGIPNFHIFGEVAAETVDVAQLARHTRVDKLPSVLDFGFARAVEKLVAGNEGTEVLARMYQDDGLYEGGAQAALRLPTFTGNHDFGRLAWMIRTARPGASDEEMLKRVMLSNAMLFLLRGVPVVYYGDEQGFVGHGIDQDSRAGSVREPGRELQRPGLVRYRNHHGGGELQSAASACMRRSRGSRNCGSRTWRCGAAGRWFARMARSRGCSPPRVSAATAAKSSWHSTRRWRPPWRRSRWSPTRKCSRRCAALAPPRQARRAASASKCRRWVMWCVKERRSEVSLSRWSALLLLAGTPPTPRWCTPWPRTPRCARPTAR